MKWRIERYTGEPDLEFAVRRFRVTKIATGIALAVFAFCWWLFPFSGDQNAFVLFLTVVVTAFAALFAFSTLIVFVLLAGLVTWYWAELRHPAMKKFRSHAEQWGGWFSPLLLLGFAGYSLFRLFTKEPIPFFGKRTTFLVTSQEYPVALFGVSLVLGHCAAGFYCVAGL